MKKLVPHNPQWASDFQIESSAVAIALGGIATTIHHIGSTSIPDIFAKPIIDILVEVVAVALVDGKNSGMESIGYECMGEYGISGRRYFRKVDGRGARTHHVHVFNAGTEQVVRHLAFRDYLIVHPAKAREYSVLKQELAAAHKEDWHSYLHGKDPFIKTIGKTALEWYKR